MAKQNGILRALFEEGEKLGGISRKSKVWVLAERESNVMNLFLSNNRNSQICTGDMYYIISQVNTSRLLEFNPMKNKELIDESYLCHIS